MTISKVLLKKGSWSRFRLRSFRTLQIAVVASLQGSGCAALKEGKATVNLVDQAYPMRAIIAMIAALIVIGQSTGIHAQEIPAPTEQQLEDLASVDESAADNESYLLEFEQYRRNPINLQTAESADLEMSSLFSAMQISNLLAYRQLLGRFISIYELQAIPGWDLELIRKVLPFITINTPLSIRTDFVNRFRAGDHSLILRGGQMLERVKGFAQGGVAGYLGSRQRLLLRYRYQFKNLLQYGIVADKDAGERLFGAKALPGFDFTSFHLFLRKLKRIQTLAIGDFTVNMGQGLICWQGLAFRKSAMVMNIKRQSPALVPYNSGAEWNFNRGVGATLGMGYWSLTMFASIRKLSANLVFDSVTHRSYVTAIQTSGNHRTQAELSDRNVLKQQMLGGIVRYTTSRLQVSLNTVMLKFATPFRKKQEPYNLFAFDRDRLLNGSIDYRYTFRQFHVFGELAIDDLLHPAMVTGLLISPDAKIDLSILHRSLSPRYQVIYGNAFTENTIPVNESGWFGGITLRPHGRWKVDAYVDLFRFPWLRSRSNGPATGYDLLLQLSCNPSKQVEIYSRYHWDDKEQNDDASDAAMHGLITNKRQNWRIQVSCKLNTSLTIRQRVEIITTGSGTEGKEQGFLCFIDGIYKPLSRPYSMTLRLERFETGGYDSRIYSYENDIMYSSSIPAAFGYGWRYYVVAGYDIGPRMNAGLKFAQTVSDDAEGFGSGLDEMTGRHRSDLKLQISYSF